MIDFSGFSALSEFVESNQLLPEFAKLPLFDQITVKQFDAVMLDPARHYWTGVLAESRKLGGYFSPNPVAEGEKGMTRVWSKTEPTEPTEPAAFHTLFVEIDPVNPADQASHDSDIVADESARAVIAQWRTLQNTVAAGIPTPTAVVMSGDFRSTTPRFAEFGKSLHIFWRLKQDISRSFWLSLQEMLVDLYDADLFCLEPGIVARHGGVRCFMFSPETMRYETSIVRDQTILHLGDPVDADELFDKLDLVTSNVRSKLQARRGAFATSRVTR